MITLRKIKTNLEVFYSEDDFNFEENFKTSNNFEDLFIYSDYGNLEFHYEDKYKYSLEKIDHEDFFTIKENRVDRIALIKTLVKYYDYSYSEVCYESIKDILSSLEITQREYKYIFEEIEEILNTANIPYKKNFEYLEINGSCQGDVLRVIVLTNELKEIWGNTPNIKELKEEFYNYAYSSTLYGSLDISFEYTVNAVNYPISVHFEDIREVLNSEYELDFNYSVIHNAILANSAYPLNIKELKDLFVELEGYSYNDIKY